MPLLVAVPLGRASDRWRPRYLLTGGIALGAVACVLLGTASGLWGLALASSVLGLGHLALTLAGQSLIARQSDDALHDGTSGAVDPGLVVTACTYRLTEQGHITDRYTKAIEQLGSDKLDVHLGGIHGLERIAVDSKRDHPTVV